MRQGLWRQLCEQYTVVVPSTVVHTEARFLDHVPGKITPIFLDQEVAGGQIQQFEATPAELAEVLRRWPAPIRGRADPGEVEALAFLQKHQQPDVAYLVADGPAIQAVIALDCAGKPLSLESLFRVSGCPRSDLEWRFTDAFVAKHRAEGLALLMGSLSIAAPAKRKRRR